MEKLLVISDIHGALAGAELVRAAHAFHSPDRILCLGDILYHGPRNDLPETYAPKKVIEIMNSLAEEIIAVRGNCEAEVDQMVLSFPCMADYSILDCEGHAIFMTHGHVYSPDKLPVLKKKSAFLYGHTHIPEAEEKDGILLLNPGSVSLPKNDCPPTYGLLDHSGFTVFTADHRQYMHIDWL